MLTVCVDRPCERREYHPHLSLERCHLDEPAHIDVTAGPQGHSVDAVCPLITAPPHMRPPAADRRSRRNALDPRHPHRAGVDTRQCCTVVAIRPDERVWARFDQSVKALADT